MLLPLVVLLCCSGLTWLTWRDAKAKYSRELQTYFDFHIRDVQARIELRMKTYEQVLRDVQGFFITSQVNRKAFHRFIAAVRLSKNFPGIEAVAYSVIVPKVDRGKLIASIRAEGFKHFTIWPAGDRDLYSPIIYLEPFEGRHLRAFGFDMFSEPVRRAAMELSRDLGDVAISGKVRLAQANDQDIQVGFLMFFPVFHQGPSYREANTVGKSEQQGEIRAWVCAPFRMNDLMTGVFGEQNTNLGIRIYDGSRISDDKLMFANTPGESAGSHLAYLQAQREVQIGHHPWTLVIHALPGFDAPLGPRWAGMLLGVGMLASLLLTLLTWSLVGSRDRAIALAEARETRFKALMRQANDGILLMNPSGQILDVNDQAGRYFGYTLDELKSMHLKDLYDSEGSQAVQEKLLMIRDRGRAQFQTVHRRKDGSLADSEVSARVVDLESERLMLFIVRDITERKRLEETLRAYEARFRSMIESSSAVMLLIDPVDGRIVDANPAAASFYGFSRESLRAMHLSDINQLPCEQLRETFLSAAREERRSFIFHHRLASGEIRTVEVASSPTEILGSTLLFSIVTDITGRLRFEEELAHQKEELEKLNLSLETRVQEAVSQLRMKDQILITQSRQAAMGEMVGNIAHQWRQPLNGLSLILANLGDTYRLGELDPVNLERALAKGDALIQKMSTTIDDFRYFFRPVKERKLFSALAQIRNTVALVEASFQASHIAIQIEAPTDIQLFGFPNEYSQVLLNLLSNAKQAIQDTNLSTGLGIGLGIGQVSLCLSETDDFGCLTVRDNGGGIPEKYLDKIFEPYFSTRESGTGIGLYMSKQIIEQNMEGKLIARNTTDGAEFDVLVPKTGERP